MKKPTTRSGRRASFGNVRQLTSGRFQATYVDGTGRRQSLGTFTTRGEANARIAMVQSAMTVGDYRDPRAGEITVAEYMESWIEANTTWAASTTDLYSRILTVWINGGLPYGRRGATRIIQLGTRAIGTVSPLDVREWHAAVLAESIRRAHDRRLAAQTSTKEVNAAIRRWARVNGREVADTGRIPSAVRRAWLDGGGLTRLNDVEHDANAGYTEQAQAYRVLHAAMARAVKDGFIRTSPCQIDGAMQADEKRRSERTTIAVPQIAALAEAMPERYATAVWIAATCGLRAGELFGLQRKHVDLGKGVIVVAQSLDRSHRTAFSTTKTKAGERVVDLPASVAAMLESHMRRHTRLGPNALVFATDAGTAVTDSSRSRMMKSARQAIDVDRLTWHDLRHTAVSLAADLRVPDSVALARHGHADKRSAARYEHQRSGAGALAAAQIDERIITDLRAVS